jgi:membrane-bound serine protease (ClpP class)
MKRRALAALSLALGVIGLAAPVAADGHEVARVELTGVIDQVNAVYVEEALRVASEDGAVAVLLVIDSPGGELTSMDRILKANLASKVPVIAWVAPEGARAGSAATFITLAADVAAMAPNTNIGAASVVGGGGEDLGETLAAKVTNDAVARIRSLAEAHGRNADWAEDAVREAVAINQNEAVELDVVDFVADNLDDVLAQSEGRIVQVPDETGAIGERTLALAGAPVQENGTNVFEQLLYVIADPNIAFLLITLGGLAIVAEIFSTNGVTGIFGAIALILAFFALGSLPTNWAGVALITFGFALIVGEIFVSGFGVLGIGGIIALALGGLILTGSSEPGFQVSRWLVITMAAIIGVLTLGFLGILVRSRRMPSHSGRESLVGAKGVTKGKLDPVGSVLVTGERWDAKAEDPPLPDNTPIVVTASQGFHLTVKRDPASIPLLTSGHPQSQESEEAVTSTPPA